MAGLTSRDHIPNNWMDRLEALERELETLKRLAGARYRGTSTEDFTTTTLPHPGDYGIQTTANEVQINVAGTIRAISTAAL